MKKTLLLFILVLTFVAAFLCLSACGSSPIYYTVQYHASEGGTIEGKLDQVVEKGSAGTTVTAVADEGYLFVKWSDGVTSPSRREENVTVDITVTAQFQKQVTQFEVQYFAAAGGKISGETYQLVEAGKNATSVTAVPYLGYQFVRWSDDITTPERTDLNIQTSITVTAIFKKEEFLIEYLTDGNGYIEGETSQIVNYGNDATEVTAIPNEGYRFVRWSDGVTEATRLEKMVRSPIRVIALFEEVIFVVQYKTDGNGYIEGETNQAVSFGGNTTTVTAIPHDGYQFEQWSDGNTEAVRTDSNVLESTTLTAFFKRQSFNVVYLAEPDGAIGAYGLSYGYVGGWASQTVLYGDDAEPVEAIPTEAMEGYGYAFLYWSDGLETAKRQDMNITCDMEVTAYFGHEINYVVDKGVGGEIIGNTNQRLKRGEAGEDVLAVAAAGYVFAGWSDFSMDSEHATREAPEWNWEYVAYFEPIEKTFAYDFGELYHGPLLNTVTVNRNELLANAEFSVPELKGYSFLGWYTDETFTTKIANEAGRLMLGYYTFQLETQTLYARWQKDGEDEVAPTYKILLTMTDELHTILYSPVLDDDVIVDYKMSALEKKFVALMALRMSEYLNEWFEDSVNFEVDSYFTIAPVGTEEERIGKDIFQQGHYGPMTTYWLYPHDLQEVWDLQYKYNSALNTLGLHDDEHILHSYNSAGITDANQSSISLDSMFAGCKTGNVPLQNIYETILAEESYSWTEWLLDIPLHEFTHTVELCYDLGELFDYHMADYYARDGMEASKLYLLHQLEVDGELVGIPPEFWRHEIQVWVNYVDKTIEQRPVGYLRIPGEAEIYRQGVVRRVPYGADFSVEAVPYEGYRFVRWSDGVPTAIRHDRNIITQISVLAIFEKI